eukprot:TRINITY_DN5938_c0_g1_i5.p2 TRINITY_DN5938_c0_g1~~TRINITY_DN5938_c0_g1_i5.p2  ORF type:complete len:183 (+),score=28.41 TRINITY_DN5938_c0_g1_i5:853-1401(+)
MLSCFILSNRIQSNVFLCRLDWSTEIKDLNYQYFAPIFFAGIMEQDDPFCTIARRGSLMLIQHEDSVPKLLALVSTITEKVLDAIQTRHPPTMAWGLYLFNNLSERDPQLAQALSRFYKHLTPLFRMYLDKYVPVDESYEAKKKMELNFNEVLRTTIEIMIRTQGQDAILLIKRAAPTFHYV